MDVGDRRWTLNPAEFLRGGVFCKGGFFCKGDFLQGGFSQSCSTSVASSFSASTLQPKDIMAINNSLNNNLAPRRIEAWGLYPASAKTLPCKKPPFAEKPPSLVYYFTGIVFYFHDVRYEALIFLVYLPYVGEWKDWIFDSMRGEPAPRILWRGRTAPNW